MSPVLYANATFHTLDVATPRTDALLADNGRILAVGPAAGLRAHAPAGTAVVDLEGKAVVPGFTDAHIHTASLARAMQQVEMGPATSLEQALDALRDTMRRYRPGQWVFGGWWNHNKWAVPVQPTAASLDRIAPDNPVALTSSDGHTVWANSLGLRRLGIGGATPNPAGGEIVRDTTGRATGILRESAVFPVRELQAGSASGDLVEQLRSAQRSLLSFGLTSVHDIDAADALAAYRTLRANGEQGVRLHKLLMVDELDAAIDAGIRTGDGDEWIRHGAVKIFADGAAGSHTCRMSEHFPGEPHNFGVEVTARPQLLATAIRAADAGIAVAVHAIGDQASHMVLDVLGELQKRTRRAGLRHRVEHAQFLQRADVARMARLGAIASMQPQHCPSDLDLLGMVAGRDLACYAWRSLLDAGAVVAFGSDAPVEVPNPLLGLHAAVTRTDAHGKPDGGWEPQERISLAEALHAYCVAPAFASTEEADKGRLAPGMLADFAVLDADPFDIDVAGLPAVKVDMTVVGGDVKYRRGEA